MTPTKRLHWIAFIFVAVFGYTQMVCAQDYPSRLIKIIVPISTGSTTDVVARIIAEAMRTATGQSVIVENRPGVGGTVGSAEVAKFPTDGHTLLVIS